jgi:hypothetical protein
MGIEANTCRPVRAASAHPAAVVVDGIGVAQQPTLELTTFVAGCAALGRPVVQSIVALTAGTINQASASVVAELPIALTTCISIPATEES